MQTPALPRAPRVQHPAVVGWGILGLATLLSSEWCVDIAEVAVGATHTTVGDAAFRLAFALCCAWCATHQPQVQRLGTSRVASVGLLAGLLIGQGCYILAPLLAAPGAVKIAGGVILGGTSAIVLLRWLACCCSAEPRTVAIMFSTAYLLTSAIYFVLAALHPPVATAIVVALPLISGLLSMVVQSKDGQGAFQDTGIDAKPTAPPFPVRPVVLIVAFELVFNLSLAFSSGASMYGPLGILVVSAITLALALAFKEEQGFNPSVLFKIALPCMIAGLLMISWVQLGANVATLFSNAGNIAFKLFILITLANACRRYHVSPLWLFGIAEGTAYAATCVGKIAGRLCTTLYPGGSLESSAVVMVAVVGLVTLCMFFSGERLALRTFGGSFGQDAPHANPLANVEAPVMACALASRRFGLSRREEEILGLLLQDMSAGQIEEELAISRSTVKSHIQHIYEKTGVHSRGELKNLVPTYELGAVVNPAP